MLVSPRFEAAYRALGRDEGIVIVLGPDYEGRIAAARGTEPPIAAQPEDGLLFTNSGSWGNISCIVRRQTGTGERENGQIVRCNAAWGR